jgi:hypothetical protein
MILVIHCRSRLPAEDPEATRVLACGQGRVAVGRCGEMAGSADGWALPQHRGRW